MTKKNKIKIFTILLTLFIITSSMVVFSFSEKQDIKPSEYKIGISYEKAINGQKPFIMLFYTDWCSYCIKFMPKYKSISEKYNNKYNFVMIKADEKINAKITNKYTITSLPSLYIIDPTIDNRIFINQGIFESKEKIKEELDRYIRIKAMIK